MLRNIQNFFLTLDNDGEVVTFDTAVNPQKAVVMLWGAVHDEDTVDGTYNIYAWAYQAFPVFKDFSSSSISLTWSRFTFTPAKISMQIIEYV